MRLKPVRLMLRHSLLSRENVLHFRFVLASTLVLAVALGMSLRSVDWIAIAKP